MTQNAYVIRRVSERVASAAAAIAMTALLAIASDARAGNTAAATEPPKVAVEYSAVEAATDEGAAKLYQKLKIAAHSVCDVYDGKTLQQKVVEKKCYEKTLQAAVNKVNAYRVTALYESDAREFG